MCLLCCESYLLYMSMYYVFVFAIHKSLFSIHTMSQKSDFMCLDKFTKCQISGFRALLGSPWLATGSYFGKMEPRASGSFLDRFWTSRPIFLIKKSILIEIWGLRYIKFLKIGLHDCGLNISQWLGL